MNSALLAKEIRQHGAVFLALFVLNTAGTLLVARAISASGTNGSVLGGAGLSLASLLAITAAVAAHRLVVLEYQKKTNLFLEALPLPRWRMLLSKLVLGWVAVLVTATAVLLSSWLFAQSEVRTPRFLAIVLSRALLWASFVYGFFFISSFLGRYRLPFHLFTGFTLLWLSADSGMRPAGFPPFALINPHRFGFERDDFPVRDLLATSGIVAGLFSGALLLGLVREGSVATMLGERMSHRERLFFGGAFLVLVSVLLLVDHHQAEPFELPGALEEERYGIQLRFSPEDPTRPIDRELTLASSLAAVLAEERDWLQIPASRWPAIFVVERPGMEGASVPYEAGALEEDEACLVYADYRRPSFPDSAFAHFVVRQCLSVYSRHRIDREERRWIFDGLQLLRELRSASPDAVQTWAGRASRALHDHPLTAASLRGWDRYEDSAGEEPARALSWHLLHTLREQAGEERFRSFVTAALGPPVPARDVRAVVRDRLHPTARIFANTIGTSLPEFVARWQGLLAPPAAPATGTAPHPAAPSAPPPVQP